MERTFNNEMKSHCEQLQARINSPHITRMGRVGPGNKSS